MEQEIWEVQQRLDAANAELKRLSTLLDELEASGGNHTRIDDLLADKQTTRANISTLNSKLSQLNLRLDEQRELENKKRNHNMLQRWTLG